MPASPRRRSGRAISPCKIDCTPPCMLGHPLAVKTTSLDAQRPSTPRLQRRLDFNPSARSSRSACDLPPWARLQLVDTRGRRPRTRAALLLIHPPDMSPRV
ncbi:hypothetical protein FA95DRAFT_1612973 [Auriscalpium vulgare]|uniref:Uncharacterized protein n=1 Tax=Auriscalpium vulgare TaxID=40419 RepID=A0ACB8R4G4_9AGAM|nr:hypothetical protein FA95DRAFT_1612973 [Auriscalpium vulgare]